MAGCVQDHKQAKMTATKDKPMAITIAFFMITPFFMFVWDFILDHLYYTINLYLSKAKAIIAGIENIHAI